jgi:hypothetical protein
MRTPFRKFTAVLLILVMAVLPVRLLHAAQGGAMAAMNHEMMNHHVAVQQAVYAADV